MKATRLGLLGLAALCLARALVAQAPAAAPSPSIEERLAAKAAEHRLAVSFRDGTFSGPGWELLLEEGRKSRFFLVGEEHGVAETPAVVRELFRALQPAGYHHLAIEISPPMAAVLDELARGPDGLGRLAAFFAENPPGVAFFTLREEAELLVAARAAVPSGEPVLWGLDYEVAGDRFLLGRMRQRAPEGAARAAVETLYERSAAAWTTVKETKDPAAFFTFANAPDVLAGVRQAWPSPDPESALALDTLEETLAINQLFVTGSNWESNQRRAAEALGAAEPRRDDRLPRGAETREVCGTARRDPEALLMLDVRQPAAPPRRADAAGNPRRRRRRALRLRDRRQAEWGGTIRCRGSHA